jgi:PKD repeat protein
MSNVRSVRRCLLPAFAGLLLMAGAVAQPAHASFGEITRFGAKGVAKQQFTERTGTVAFGVDPVDSSVYVGDEPEKGGFRVQKLSATGTFIAEARFKLKGSEERPAGIEGIAVDSTSAEGRIYVLAIRERRTQNEAETVADPETPAAGSLYAFQSKPTGEKLEPAAGTKENPVTKQNEGLLAQLKGESEKIADVLLEPSGIAVDPITHDVIVAGSEDRGTLEEPTLRAALQRVSSAGKIGARWVDKAPEPFFEEAEVSSPVVSTTGKVYVLGGEHELPTGEKVEEVDEIPANFESSESPKPIVKYNPGPGISLATFPGLPAPTFGGGLSLDPETGSLWIYANIEREEKPEVFKHGRGALEFDPLGNEIGWTGGEIWTKSSTAPCAISFEGHPTVAAGTEGRVFMFDSNPEAPRVVVFGPGGSGCPTASASAPIATINGTPVSSVTPNAEVVFSSKVTQANALKVDWSFGDGTPPQTVGTNEYQTPQIAHKFAKSGKFAVTETIHSDNLETPEIKKTIEFTVEPGPPTATFKAPEEVKVGQAAEFDAKNSSDPNGSPIAKYAWDFGDGKTETTTTPTAKHTYAAALSYEVTLRVTDGLSLTSSPATHLVRVVAEAPKEEPKEPPKEERKEEGSSGGATAGTSTSASATSSAGAASGGAGASVLSYIVRVASTQLSVSRAGALPIKVNCAGSSACSGSVTLRTLSAVSAGGKHKAILMLAAGSFTLAGGQIKLLTLHLSTKARQLLKRSHVLRARATIVARDSYGTAHTTAAIVTLRAGKH